MYHAQIIVCKSFTRDVLSFVSRMLKSAGQRLQLSMAYNGLNSLQAMERLSCAGDPSCIEPPAGAVSCLEPAITQTVGTNSLPWPLWQELPPPDRSALVSLLRVTW